MIKNAGKNNRIAHPAIKCFFRRYANFKIPIRKLERVQQHDLNPCLANACNKSFLPAILIANAKMLAAVSVSHKTRVQK